jgi:hypothetical protein
VLRGATYHFSSGRTIRVSSVLHTSAICIDQKTRRPFLCHSGLTPVEWPVIRNDNLLRDLLRRWWHAYS